MVQWLELALSLLRVQVQFVWGTKIPPAAWCGQKTQILLINKEVTNYGGGGGFLNFLFFFFF